MLYCGNVWVLNVHVDETIGVMYTYIVKYWNTRARDPMAACL